MLGAIIGDIVGSVYEFKNYRSKGFTPFFHLNSKFTDDTVCTTAVADCLLNNIPPEVALKSWGRRYWSNGGWGKQFATWLASPETKPFNSYGNGSAMRVSSCVWLSDTLEAALKLANDVTVVTHNHPEGIKGALATAEAIYHSIHGMSKSELRKIISDKYGYDMSRNIDEIRINNPRNETCQKTVPEAITCALESVSFEDAIRNAVSIGGDSDTIAAITGSIAEAMHGIPDEYTAKALGMLPQDIRQVVDQFYASVS